MKWNQLTCNKQSRSEWVNDSNYERFAPKKNFRPNDENYTDHYLVHVREPSKNFVPNRMQTYTWTGLLKLGRNAAHTHRERDNQYSNSLRRISFKWSFFLLIVICTFKMRSHDNKLYFKFFVWILYFVIFPILAVFLPAIPPTRFQMHPTATATTTIFNSFQRSFSHATRTVEHSVCG